MKQVLIIFFISFLLISCSKEKKVLRLATTTSVNDTALLDILAKKLLVEKNIELQWVSVGTGKALILGKQCDVDIVLSHSPNAEIALVADGSLRERTPFMENYFIIVGDSKNYDDLGTLTVPELLYAITEKKIPFISRGDDSGTHKKELELWHEEGIIQKNRDDSWYMETGQGMLQSLVIAQERKAFTITDVATWRAFKKAYPNTNLIEYTEKSEELINVYSMLLANTEHCPNTNDELAREFLTWILSQPIQKFISEYTLEDKVVFYPYYIDGMPR